MEKLGIIILGILVVITGFIVVDCTGGKDEFASAIVIDKRYTPPRTETYTERKYDVVWKQYRTVRTTRRVLAKYEVVCETVYTKDIYKIDAGEYQYNKLGIQEVVQLKHRIGKYTKSKRSTSIVFNK